MSAGAMLLGCLGYALAVALYATGFIMFAGGVSGKFSSDDNNGLAFWLSFTFWVFGFGICAATAKLTGAI